MLLQSGKSEHTDEETIEGVTYKVQNWLDRQIYRSQFHVNGYETVI